MFPELLWAQRSNAQDAEKNVVYLTVKVADLTDEKVDLSATHFKFSGTSQGEKYAVDLELFDEIDVANSKSSKTGRGLFYVLRKKNKQEEYWPRLTKDKARKPYIQTDFEKWADEDEQEEAQEPDMGDMGAGGMDMDQMAQLQAMMGGAGGAGAGGAAGGAGGAGGMDMAQLQAMLGGMGGMGGEGAGAGASVEGLDAEIDPDELEAAQEEEPEEASKA